MEIPKLNQSPVVFDAEKHTYMLGDKYLNGITGTLVHRAYPNTYSVPAGFSEEQWNDRLRQAAEKGTAIHQAIELYEDLGVTSDIPEVRNYINIKNDNGFINLASEYLVSDEKNYASAIDHVWYQPDTKEIVIVDIKRTYEVHTDEVTCQTSIYKHLFLLQNPHLKDYNISIALLWLRGDKYEFRILHALADEVIDALIDADIKNEVFDIQQHFGEMPVKFADVEDKVAMLYNEINEKKKMYEELTKGLLNLMLENGINKFTGSKIQLTVTKPQKRESFDKECFKNDHPELYENYKTYTEVKPSLRITVKK